MIDEFVGEEKPGKNENGTWEPQSNSRKSEKLRKIKETHILRHRLIGMYRKNNSRVLIIFKTLMNRLISFWWRSRILVGNKLLQNMSPLPNDTCNSTGSALKPCFWNIRKVWWKILDCVQSVSFMPRQWRNVVCSWKYAHRPGHLG